MPFRRLLSTALLLMSLAGCERFMSAEQRVERAESAIAAGDHRRAVVDLLNALQDQPDNARARLLLAESALWLGDAPGAARQLERLPAGADPVRRALLEVRVALTLNQLEAAEKRLGDEGVRWPPGQREWLRGQLYLLTQRPAEAQREFAAAHAADPSLIVARAAELEARAAQGERAAALEGLAQLTRQYPDSAAGWMAYAAQLGAAGRTRDSLPALERARGLAPRQLESQKHAMLLAALVETQLLEGDLEAARAGADELAKVAPDAIISRYIRARISMASNDHVNAVKQLRQVLQVAPNLMQARMMLAMSLVAQGHLEQASVALNELVALAPDNVGARQLLAQVRMRLDDPDGALRMLVPALQAGGASQINALIDAARSRLGAEQSVALLEQLAAAQPENRGLQAQLAAAYLQAGSAAKAAALLRGEGGAGDTRRAALLLRAVEAAEGGPAARAHIDAMIASSPGDTLVANLAAAFHARNGDFAAGRSVLQAAMQRGADPGVLLLTLAQLEWSAGQRDAAASALNRLVQLQPDNAAARLATGEIALGRNDLAVARQQFTHACKAGAGAIEACMRLAQVALTEFRTREADDLLADVVKRAPGRADVRNAAGVLNMNSGRADVALAHFRAAVELTPAEPLGWFNLAGAQHALGQAVAARESLEKALEARANWLPAAAALVWLDIEARNERAAFARIAALKEALPGVPEVLEIEGDAHGALLRHREAVAAYQLAYEKRPSAAVAMKDYRTRITGGLPEPTHLLARWSAANPRDVDARQLLADAAMRAGDPQKAEEHYRAVLERRPDDVTALNNLAWIYQQRGDRRGIDLARRAVKLAPRSAAVNDTLGWILVQTGLAAEGANFLAQAVQLAPNDAEIGYHHAVALAETGRPAEARQHLESLLRTHPAFTSRPAAEAALRKLPAAPAGG